MGAAGQGRRCVLCYVHAHALPYKVLDLTDQWGMFCGYILAHLGAQVLAVEPPGGSAVRAMQPLAGDDDRAPVRTSVPQSFLHAGADAASAALIALQARHATGLGQQVDVSAQQSAAQAALGMVLAAPNNGGFAVQRFAGGLRGTFPLRFTWPCRDDYVTIMLMFGHAFEEPNRKLLRWLHEHGACSTEDVATDWDAEARVIGAGERALAGPADGRSLRARYDSAPFLDPRP